MAEQILKMGIHRLVLAVDIRSEAWGCGHSERRTNIETEIIKYIQEERPQKDAGIQHRYDLFDLAHCVTSAQDCCRQQIRLRCCMEFTRTRRAPADLLQIDLLDDDRLRLRLYGVPPSLRGRHIGEMVVLGWYNGIDNKRIEVYDPASVEVWGHDNAVVAGRHDEPDGAVLATWFSREFDRLWWHRSTLDEATSAGVLDTEP